MRGRELQRKEGWLDTEKREAGAALGEGCDHWE